MPARHLGIDFLLDQISTPWRPDHLLNQVFARGEAEKQRRLIRMQPAIGGVDPLPASWQPLQVGLAIVPHQRITRQLEPLLEPRRRVAIQPPAVAHPFDRPIDRAGVHPRRNLRLDLLALVPPPLAPLAVILAQHARLQISFRLIVGALGNTLVRLPFLRRQADNLGVSEERTGRGRRLSLSDLGIGRQQPIHHATDVVG